MKTLNIRSILSGLVMALVLLLGTGSVFTVASAAEDKGQISQEQLDKLAKASDEDREKVRTTAVEKYTHEFCSQIVNQAVAFPGQDKNKICSDEVGANVNKLLDTPEKGLQGELNLQEVCGAAGANVANYGLKKACIVGAVQTNLKKVLPVVKVALLMNPTISGIINAGEAAQKVTEYIKDAKDPFEMLVNHAHDEAVNWTVKVMDTATGSTDFDPTQTWFTTSWAAAAGVGLLLMGIMFLLMLKDLGNGDIDEDEFRNSLLRWGPAAVLMATFGPALMGKLTGVVSSLNSGVITARGDNLTSHIMDFLNSLAALSSASGLGTLLMIIVFIVMIIAALMLYIVFLVQHFALIMLAYGIAIMLGALMNPKWRPGLLKAASTWVTVLFSKTVLLIMMALIFSIDFASIAADDGLGILSQTVIIILAMGAVAFSPMVLLKYVPMVSSPGALSAPSGPAVSSYTGGGSNSQTSYMSEQVSRGNEKASSPAAPAAGGTSGSAGATSSGDAGSSSSASPVTSGSSSGAGSTGASSSATPASGASSSSTAATTSDSSSTPGHENATSSDADATGTGTPATSTGSSTLSGAGSSSSSAAPVDGSSDTGAVDAGEDYSSVKPASENGVAGTNAATGKGPSAAPQTATASSASTSAGTSSATSGSGASGTASGSSGAGAAAGGAFAGVLLAAAATKKAADTGKDTLVGLNAEAANFQDYNSDTQPTGR